MTTHKKKGFYFFPGIKNIILLGVGWNNYQSNPDWASRFYYNNILHKDFFHSVRDTYTLRKIEKIKQIKAINTSCPSLWSINAEFKNSYNLEFKKILFTVNGYHSSPETDNNVLKLLFESGNNEIVFFPQGKIDSEYFSNLDFFRINKNKFTILDHNFDEFKKILKGGHINYIGSRLHGGIKCLQYNIPTAILGFDNRSLEIKKDTILNVIEKNNLNNLREWIEGKFIPPKISLPYENINIWKNQFK